MLVHAVSLASFSNTTGFFKFWVEVAAAAAVCVCFSRHRFYLSFLPSGKVMYASKLG